MNKTQLIVAWLIWILLLLPNTCASLPEIYFPSQRKETITDEQLGKIAVENGIIPADVDRAYLDEQIEDGNTTLVWILANRDSKIRMIEGFKKEFLKQEGAIINYPALYYVNEMNRGFYGAIENSMINEDRKKGWLSKMFKLVAMIEGDFDDGTSRVNALRNYAGDRVVERLKNELPDKYERLIKLDRRDKR